MFCWWPKIKSINKFYKAVQEMEEVGPNFMKCDIVRIWDGSDSFDRAKEKLAKAEDESDLNTDVDEKKSRHKRAKKDGSCYNWPRAPVPVSSDEEEMTIVSGEYISKHDKSKEKYPTPPGKMDEINHQPISTPISSSTPVLKEQMATNNSQGTPQQKDKSSFKTLMKYMIPMKYQLAAIVENQKEILENQRQMMDRICALESNKGEVRGQPAGIDCEVEVAFDIEKDFPITSVEEMMSMDTKLRDGVYKACMIQHFSKFGGRDAKCCTRGLMEKTISDNLAAQYSWAGWKKKMIFKDLQLANVICDIVRTNFKHETNDQIANHIKLWMVKSKERAERKKAKMHDVQYQGGEEETRE